MDLGFEDAVIDTMLAQLNPDPEGGIPYQQFVDEFRPRCLTGEEDPYAHISYKTSIDANGRGGEPRELTADERVCVHAGRVRLLTLNPPVC